MEIKQIINKRLLTLPTLILLIAGNLFAQPSQRGGMQGPPPLPDSVQIEKMVDELTKSISLSDEQKIQVSELHFDHFAEAKELMEENKKDRKSHHEAMDDLREEFDEQVKDLLTENQVEEFEEFIKNHPKPHGKKRPGRK